MHASNGRDESDPAHWRGRYPNEFRRDAVAPVADALLHHDRGGRYLSTEFRAICMKHGIAQSVGHIGLCPFTG